MTTSSSHAGAVEPPEVPVPLAHVDPFVVADLSSSDVVELLVRQVLRPRTRPYLAFALHVGGLNSRADKDFVLSMREADVVYADGGSVVWLARLAGARAIERAPTTDVGWDVLRDLTRALGRPPRVALIGGSAGLAERAGAVLESAHVATVVFTAHGYQDRWDPLLTTMRETDPEVCIVGLGAPREMIWSHRNRSLVTAPLLLTCGGWFGHLAGDERRAPRVLRRSGLEWIARLVQAPTRLGPRYAEGLLSTLLMSIRVVLGPRRGRG
jgi:N-acetylglucosaminyldiphosphoundecaprenol N-acetyl-beta-D-mannosaminyltransferase